jgi:hypothetical protein
MRSIYLVFVTRIEASWNWIRCPWSMVCSATADLSGWYSLMCRKPQILQSKYCPILALASTSCSGQYTQRLFNSADQFTACTSWQPVHCWLWGTYQCYQWISTSDSRQQGMKGSFYLCRPLDGIMFRSKHCGSHISVYDLSTVAGSYQLY